MALTRRCSENFSNEVKRRGESYFQSGKVTSTSVQDKLLSFLVQGSYQASYKVALSYNSANTSIQVSCECPFFEDGLLCKHIWAALMKADADGLDARLPGQHRLFVFHGIGEDDDETEESQTEETPTTQEDPSSTVMQDYLRLKWRTRLDAISGTTFSSSQVKKDSFLGQKELWYVVSSNAALNPRLTVSLFQRQFQESGSWTPLKDLRITIDEANALPPGQDAEILQFLLGLNLEGSSTLPRHTCEIPQVLYEMIIPQLCMTERLVLDSGGSTNLSESPPLKWAGHHPWQFQLEWKQDDSKWLLDGWIVRSEEKVNLSEITFIDRCLFVYKNQLGLLETDTNWRWANDIKKKGAIEIQAGEEEAFIQSLVKIPSLPIGDWPEELPWKRLSLSPTAAHISFGLLQSYTTPVYKYDISFDYGGNITPRNSISSVILDIPNKQIIVRDRKYENECLEYLLTQIQSLGQTNSPIGTSGVTLEHLPALADALIARGWHVDLSGRKLRVGSQFKVSVTSGIDWFDVQIEGKFEDTAIGLPALLKNVKAGNQIIRLDDGTVGILPQEWFRKMCLIEKMSEDPSDTSLKVRKAQLTILNSLLENVPDLTVDKIFAELRKKLEAFDGIKPQLPSKKFKGKLRHYQKEGLGWLEFLKTFEFGGCLADDMGLGKTIQVLAFLQKHHQKSAPPTLIVVPKSLVYNWAQEAKHFTPNLKLLIYTGGDRHNTISNFQKYDIVITTYGTLRRDIEKLAPFQFQWAILDEAQNIKNSGSQAARACRLLKAKQRLALTGTPVENRLSDLWSIFEFLNPSMLGSSSLFQKFITNDKGSSKEVSGILQKALIPFILRRTKENVLKELPSKTEQVIYCDLEPDLNNSKCNLRLPVLHQLPMPFI